MVAERTQLGSLQRPPEGWESSPEVRAIRAMHTPRKRGGTADPLYDGARADAAPTDALPTLTIGVSALPTSCPNCGSRYLNAEPPLGKHARGMISCGRCSRQVCWLRALSTSRAPQDSAPEPSALPTRSDVKPTSLGRAHISARFNRGPGCGRTCSIAYGHDPVSHEAHGRREALEEVAAKPTGTLRTGALLIDFDERRVTVDGNDPDLTPTETAILLCLASRFGAVLTYQQLVEEVWDAETWAATVGTGEHAALHMLRINVHRLRKKLGPARPLLETATSVGYVLRRRLTSRDGAP